MSEADNEKDWQSHWASLGLGNLSVRATNIIAFAGNGLNTREAIIEAVKSRRLIKIRNCGVLTYNEIAIAVGLEEYCETGYWFSRAIAQRAKLRASRGRV